MLLSVVIPTKGRTEYAFKSIKYILSLKLSSLQIVVQDNNETDDLYGLLSEFIECENIIYNHTKTPLSFVDNFEEAISHATGEYITVIGDDDIINPEIINVLSVFSKFNIDSIVPSTNLFFLWPESGVTNKVTSGNEFFTFSVKPFSGQLKYVNSRVELQKLLSNGGVDYLSYNIPRLYHGIVKKSLLDKIKSKYGRLFEGLTPDIYIACLIAAESETCIRLDYPLTIPGACKSSGSVASDTGAHTGELSQAPHFNYRGTYSWNNLVPKFYSVPTIWSDSAFAAAQKTQLECYINNKLLFAKCYFEYPKYRADFINLNPFSNMISLYLTYFKYKILGFKSKIYNKFKVSTSSFYGIYHLNNLDDIDNKFKKENKIDIHSKVRGFLL
ncbi:glycosyltransferase family A protein [Shewanella gaetbuli]|uniref:Glycosyltransferase n=1 Tax=Shewanella gaetbuli TaxID=220752 RepID=A0A9X2CKE5_9GAMM|nr:glycosyltransferase [Shewanella gaetbuli]MCL1141560.1 glycosyltransferase [Shewanella gaetbuli]